MSEGDRRAEGWERRLEWPLTGLAVFFLGLYAFDVLDTGLSSGERDATDFGLTVIWAVFGVDYLIRLALAADRRRYVRTHVLDLVILLLPMARPLRALRALAMISAVNRRMRGRFRGRVAVYVSATTLLVCIVASLAELEAERYAPHATITTFGAAVWWTISTIATVGYGDLYPVTAEGRVVASMLMIGGIAMLGVVTGSFATWFVDNLRQVEQDVEQTSDRVTATLDELLAQLRLLNGRVDAMETRSLRLGQRVGDNAAELGHSVLSDQRQAGEDDGPET